MSTTPEHDVTTTLVENSLDLPRTDTVQELHGIGTANSHQISRTAHLGPYQWKPGESGNPSGRPKGLISASLHDYLTRNKGVKLEEMVRGAIESAIKGNPKALAVIRDSVDGRPAQSIDINANVTMTLADRLEQARKAIKEESGE